MLDKSKVIKNHYLLNSESGYFFKYTIKSDNYYFLNAISTTFELSIDDIKSKIIKYLEEDKSDLIFTYLSNGDIKTQFKDKNNYINFINNNNYFFYKYSSLTAFLCKHGTITSLATIKAFKLVYIVSILKVNNTKTQH